MKWTGAAGRRSDLPRSWPARQPLRILLGLACLVGSVHAADVAAAERYEPRLRFRSLRTEHFTIHFHQGLQPQAERLAHIAESVHETLAPQFPGGPRRHTHVILVDQHDDANGWATPLPFNTIEITAAAPPPSGTIGYTDDWLELVFTHEYTHILHLDRSRGFFRALRAVFGRAPAAFPNMFLPGWNVEGLATFYETAVTGQGRLRSGDFRAIVDAPSRSGEFDPIDRATGALVDWPSGQAAYAYGSRFHEYLAERFGPERFARLADATSGRIPYMPGGAFTRIFGSSAQDLWREFERATEAAPKPDNATRAVRLTNHGYVTSGPRWIDDEAIVYTARTPHRFPALMRVAAAGGASRRIAERYLGDRASVLNDRVYFDQREYVASVALKSDLYAMELSNREVRQLTRGARLTDPDISPDGREIVAIEQRGGNAVLVRLPVQTATGVLALGEPVTVIEEAESQFGAPRWSPDGTRIAVERRRLGELPHIAIVHPSGGAANLRIVAGEGRVAEPEWVDDRRLLLSWERPRTPSVVCAVDLSTGAATVVIAPVNGAHAPAISPDRRRIAFVGYTPDGYDLFSAPLAASGAPARLRILRGDEPAAVAAPPQLVSSPYSLASMAPRFWMPVIASDEDRLEVGAGTAGLDPLGRHAYAANVRWSDRARPDWDAAYSYDRWRPSLFVGASDDTTVWQQEDYRETSVDVGFLLPFRTVRRRQQLFGAFHATRERDPRQSFDRRSARVGYLVATARRYGYSISQEDGVVAGAALDLTRRDFGADADAVTLSADVRGYPRVGGGHRVLAVRAAAAASWGDRIGRRVLGAGGSAASRSPIVFGRDAIGLLRGFDADEIVGDRAVVLNVDYRIPLAVIERGLGRFPLFVRQVHGAVFVDFAHAWTERFRVEDVRRSAGVELSSDLVLGHYAPVTLASGLAIRGDPSGLHRGATAFVRIGTAF